MRINNNISALNTLRQYTTNTNATNKSMEKLSSGLRINRAGDDAAGLAISEKMRAQIRGIEMASKNSQDAISLVQTAEGALTETHSILQRMNELTIQASSDTNEDIDRNALQSEFSQLSSEIDDIASQTKFNNKYLLDGTYGGAISKGAGTSASITDSMLTIGTTAAAGNYEFTFTDATADADDVTAMGLTGIGAGVTLAADAASGDYTVTYNKAEVDTADADYAALSSAATITTGALVAGDYTFSWASGTNTLTVTDAADPLNKQDFVIADTAAEVSGTAYDAVSAASVTVDPAAVTGDYTFTWDGTGKELTITDDNDPLNTVSVTMDATAKDITLGGVTFGGLTDTTAADLADLQFSTTAAIPADVDVTFAGVTFAGLTQTEAASFDTKGFSVSDASFDVSEATAGALASGDIVHDATAKTVTFEGVTLNYGTTSETDLDTNLGSGAALQVDARAATVSRDGATAQTVALAADGSLTSNGFTIATPTAANLDGKTLELDAAALTIQTGANSGETLDIAIASMNASSLGLTGLSVTNKTNAQAAVGVVTQAINTVSTQRANLGAYQNRLEHKINNLNTSAENLQAAESRIRDVDMAQEMVEFTKNNILLQAAQSMLAQANAQPQGVLQLLQ